MFFVCFFCKCWGKTFFLSPIMTNLMLVNVSVANVYSLAQWLNAKLLSMFDSCHLYCCCCIRNSSSGFYEIIYWIWNLLSLERPHWPSIEPQLKLEKYFLSAAAAIMFCFLCFPPAQLCFIILKMWGLSFVRGGLCVWKQNCSIFEQAAVTSLFLSSPYRASMLKKKKKKT